MRVLSTVAAVLALLHGLACALGAMGMGATADQADPMSTDEATGVALLIFVIGAATIVGAVMTLAGRGPVTLVVGVSASLVVSGYLALRWSGEVGGYQIPLIYAVLPVVVLGLMAAGSRNAPVTAG